MQVQAGSDISRRLDSLPVTRLHVASVILCAFGFSFDLLEVALGVALSAVFSSAPNAIPSNQLAWLLSSVYIGAIIGAPTLGWLADRYGRRLMLMAALLFLAMTSLGAALSPNVEWLTVFRGLSGIFIGAYPPLMISFLTDLLPPRRRGMLIFLAGAVAFTGPPAAVFLVRWLTPIEPLGVEAWRWGFIVGSTGAAAVGILLKNLPDSPRWLDARGRKKEAEAACLRFEQSPQVLSSGYEAGEATSPEQGSALTVPSRRQTLWRFTVVATLNFLSPWATVAFPLLTGAILAQKGFKLTDTLLYVGVATFGPILGVGIAAFVIDKVERRVAMAGCAVLMILSGFAFVADTVPIWLMVASVLFGAMSALYLPALTVYTAELFPTQTRATSVSAAWAFNRVGAALGPLVLLPLLASSGATVMFSVIAAALLATIALLAAAPRGRARLPAG